MEGYHAGNAMAKQSGGEKVSGPPGQDVPYHAAITKLAIHPWEIRARLGYGLFSGQQYVPFGKNTLDAHYYSPYTVFVRAVTPTEHLRLLPIS